MGMWDKDILYGGLRLDECFAPGDEFILWAVSVLPEPVPTDLGDATKTLMTVSRTATPTVAFNVGTLAAAIAEKAQRAEPSDFPAVVKLMKVGTRYESDALVVQFVRRYDGPSPEVMPDINERFDEEPVGF